MSKQCNVCRLSSETEDHIIYDMSTLIGASYDRTICRSPDCPIHHMPRMRKSMVSWKPLLVLHIPLLALECKLEHCWKHCRQEDSKKWGLHIMPQYTHEDDRDLSQYQKCRSMKLNKLGAASFIISYCTEIFVAFK